MSVQKPLTESFDDEDILNLYRMRGFFREAIHLRNAAQIDIEEGNTDEPIEDKSFIRFLQGRSQKSTAVLNKKNQYKNSPPFNSYSDNAKALITGISNDLQQGLQDQSQIKDDAFTPGATLEAMRTNVKENPKMARLFLTHVNALEKEKHKAESRHKFSENFNYLFEGAMELLHLKEVDLEIPPVNWILPIIKGGLETIAFLLERSAMKHDPNLEPKHQLKPSYLSLFGTLGMFLGAILIGTAAGAVALLGASAAIFVKNFISMVKSIKETINVIKQTEPVVSKWWRRLSSGFKSLAAVNGTVCTALLTIVGVGLAIAAFGNPVGFGIGTAVLLGYTVATAVFGLVSYIGAKWAKRQGEKAEARAAAAEARRAETETTSPAESLEQNKLRNREANRLTSKAVSSEPELSRALPDLSRALGAAEHGYEEERLEPENYHPHTFTPKDSELIKNGSTLSEIVGPSEISAAPSTKDSAVKVTDSTEKPKGKSLAKEEEGKKEKEKDKEGESEGEGEGSHLKRK